jgi:protoporphyrin/coproporphyrin ferrochelatase
MKSLLLQALGLVASVSPLVALSESKNAGKFENPVEGYAKTAVLKNRGLQVPNFTRPLIGNLGWPLVKGLLLEQYTAFGFDTQYTQNTSAQAKALESALKSKGSNARVYFGYNFMAPFIETAVEQMKNDGIETIVVFNQGAQYSFATTEESFEDVSVGLDKLPGYNPTVIGYEEYSSDNRFRELFANKIEREVNAAFPNVDNQDICILLGSHGLPTSLIKKGDPATNQMLEVIEDTKSRLPQWLFFHGFLNDDFFPGAEWTSPAMRDTAVDVARDVCQHVYMDGSLSFTVHHRATLFDMNVEARGIILEEKPEAKISFAKNWDADKEFANFVADLTLESLNGVGPTKLVKRHEVR